MKLLSSTPLFTRNVLLSDQSKLQSASPSTRIGACFSPNAFEHAALLEENGQVQRDLIKPKATSCKLRIKATMGARDTVLRRKTPILLFLL